MEFDARARLAELLGNPSTGTVLQRARVHLGLAIRAPRRHRLGQYLAKDANLHHIPVSFYHSVRYLRGHSVRVRPDNFIGSSMHFICLLSGEVVALRK